MAQLDSARREAAAPAVVPEPAPARSGFLQAGGLNLHFLDYGTEGRPPMLCVHGGSAHAHWFDYVAPGFTNDYHVRSIDLRGHGESEWSAAGDYTFDRFAADLAEAVEKLDLRDFVLVGHSMGGMVSLVYAATYPGRVSRLVIVDTRTLMTSERIAKMHVFGAKPARTYPSREALIARYRLEPAGTQMAAPEVVSRMASFAASEVAEGAWQHKSDRRVYAAFERRDGMPLWAKIRVPALLVKAEYSDRVDAGMIAGLREHAPQVKVVEVPQCDHHVTLDNPPGFVEAVRTFLDQAR